MAFLIGFVLGAAAGYFLGGRLLSYLAKKI